MHRLRLQSKYSNLFINALFAVVSVLHVHPFVRHKIADRIFPRAFFDAVVAVEVGPGTSGCFVSRTKSCHRDVGVRFPDGPGCSPVHVSMFRCDGPKRRPLTDPSAVAAMVNSSSVAFLGDDESGSSMETPWHTPKHHQAARFLAPHNNTEPQHPRSEITANRTEARLNPSNHPAQIIRHIS